MEIKEESDVKVTSSWLASGYGREFCVHETGMGEGDEITAGLHTGPARNVGYVLHIYIYLNLP